MYNYIEIKQQTKQNKRLDSVLFFEKQSLTKN